eukprot:CAMPEP_0116849218 /NCGR_PEP_ID=MMETSP0418-20121206/15443_1 /TAXON_ID=1158023 /ORGANISM="Astrosyne radiata, Strain 13vi08-1A" /LENGTH=182 /DNA_ID=CAMNT_0004480901 /DNA_START=692 /DNA_END=1243 /DNA_ORIENTATION=+
MTDTGNPRISFIHVGDQGCNTTMFCDDYGLPSATFALCKFPKHWSSNTTSNPECLLAVSNRDCHVAKKKIHPHMGPRAKKTWKRPAARNKNWTNLVLADSREGDGIRQRRQRQIGRSDGNHCPCPCPCPCAALIHHTHSARTTNSRGDKLRDISKLLRFLATPSSSSDEFFAGPQKEDTLLK